eukprot:3587773-Rhodomonas_salina.2
MQPEIGDRKLGLGNNVKSLPPHLNCGVLCLLLTALRAVEMARRRRLRQSRVGGRGRERACFRRARVLRFGRRGGSGT